MTKFAILFTGLPGTGKTTVAKKLSQLLPCYYCSTDVIRSFVFNEQLIREDRDYTVQELDIIYNVALYIAKLQAENNKNLLIEGVYRNKIMRDRMVKALSDYGYTVFKYHITCDDRVAIQRVEDRKNRETLSPAGKKGYSEIKAKFEYPDEQEGFSMIDNSIDS